MPARFVHIVAVESSPSAKHAVVLVEYNEPSTVEPYVVLCEKTRTGWIERQSGSGGGLSWMATDADGQTGVEVAWGQQPTVRWGVAAWAAPVPPPDALTW